LNKIRRSSAARQGNPDQVMIESKFVEVTTNDHEEYRHRLKFT